MDQTNTSGAGAGGTEGTPTFNNDLGATFTPDSGLMGGSTGGGSTGGGGSSGLDAPRTGASSGSLPGGSGSVGGGGSLGGDLAGGTGSMGGISSTGAGSGGAMGSGSTGSGTATEAKTGLNQRASEMADQAQDKVTQGMKTAADRLDQVAGRIDTMAEQRLGGSGAQARAGDIARSTADTMESVAGYLRNNDAQALRGDLERQVRERPLQTLLIGVAMGWLAGKILR